MSQFKPCPDCGDVSRRKFLASSAGALAAVAAGSRLVAQPPVLRGTDSETLVAEFSKSLTAEQRKVIAFPFDHPLQSKVDNNWHITKARVSELTKDQQALVYDIVKGLHSPEYGEAVMKQIEYDNGGDRGDGFGKCSVAMFGEPGESGFEFVFSGRHVTRRCDGNSVEGAAFGGPIFYGHQAGPKFNEKPDHPGNVYWYQAKRANELFQALDGGQRKIALRSDPRKEQGTKTVKLTGKKEGLAGIRVSELSSDQKGLVRKVMQDVLAPFREVDVKETLKLVEAGGFDNLHMSFYKNLDVGGDGVWDVWQIEGPAMLWYFRGHPHIHTWVHVREPIKPKPKKRRVI